MKDVRLQPPNPKSPARSLGQRRLLLVVILVTAKMCPLQQASRLNNQAAALLDAGRQLEATRMLHEAINLLKTANFTLEWYAEQSAFSSSSAALRFGPIRTEADEQCRDSDGAMYIYNRPLLLPTNEDRHTPLAEPCLYTIRMVSMFIIFNLALAYQLNGRETGAESSSAQAISLYQIVLVTSNNRFDEALLQCLALNNLADLHHTLCEHYLSRYCLDCVADLVCKTECFDDAEAISDREVADITSNLMFAQFPTAAQAA